MEIKDIIGKKGIFEMVYTKLDGTTTVGKKCCCVPFIRKREGWLSSFINVDGKDYKVGNTKRNCNTFLLNRKQKNS